MNAGALAGARRSVGRWLTSRAITYAAWLVFVGALVVAPRLLLANNTVRLFHFSWLDALATAALLFGPVLLIAAAIGGGALTLLHTAAERGGSGRTRLLPQGIMLAILLAAWLHLLRGMLTINQVGGEWLNRPLELPTALIIAGGLFAWKPAAVARWVVSAERRVRAAAAGFIVVIAGLLGYVLADALRPGTIGPVTLPAADRAHPHVVVVVLDALTSLDMSLYGYHLPTTPRLDEITRTWTVFENAHATGTATTAVQPAILTGRYPFSSDWHHYGDWARASKGLLSLPHILQRAGYETIYAMGGGWPPSRYHFHTAFDRIVGGGYAAFQREEWLVHSFPGRELLNRTVWNPAIAEVLLPGRVEPGQWKRTTYDEPIYDTVAGFLRERARPEDTRPFFLYLHAMRPHQPFLGNEFRGTFLPIEEGLADSGSQEPMIHHRYDQYNPAEQREMDRLRLRYDENILKADQQLGQLVDTLKQNGLYDQTLIIITADHGSSFTGGWQGYFSPDLLLAEHQVPLLVKFPGQTEGRHVAAAVSHVDILPTVLDVVGATYPREWVDGQSLRVADLTPERVVYVTRLIDIAVLDFGRIAAIQGDLKLVRRLDSLLLFDIRRDQYEMRNLHERRETRGLHDALNRFSWRAAVLQTGGDIAGTPVPLAAGPPGEERPAPQYDAVPQ